MKLILIVLVVFSSLSVMATEKGMYYCRGEDKDVNIYFRLRFENKENSVNDAFVQVNREGGSYDGRSVRIYEQRLSSLSWNITDHKMSISLSDSPVEYKKFRLVSFTGEEALLYDYADDSADVYGYRGKLKYVYKSFWWGESEEELDFHCYLSKRIMKPSLNN